jgi:hypothetical protein
MVTLSRRFCRRELWLTIYARSQTAFAVSVLHMGRLSICPLSRPRSLLSFWVSGHRHTAHMNAVTETHQRLSWRHCGVGLARI